MAHPSPLSPDTVFRGLLGGCSEWRVSHIMSHHLFPNTLLDIELSMHEPLLQYLPTEGKPLSHRLASWVVFTLYAGLVLPLQLPYR